MQSDLTDSNSLLYSYFSDKANTTDVQEVQASVYTRAGYEMESDGQGGYQKKNYGTAQNPVYKLESVVQIDADKINIDANHQLNLSAQNINLTADSIDCKNTSNVSVAKLNGDGSGFVAGGKISWDSSGNLTTVNLSGDNTYSVIFTPRISVSSSSTSSEVVLLYSYSGIVMKGGVILQRYKTVQGLGNYGSYSLTSSSTASGVRAWLHNAANEGTGHALNVAGASNSDTSVVTLMDDPIDIQNVLHYIMKQGTGYALITDAIVDELLDVQAYQTTTDNTV